MKENYMLDYNGKPFWPAIQTAKLYNSILSPVHTNDS